MTNDTKKIINKSIFQNSEKGIKYEVEEGNADAIASLSAMEMETTILATKSKNRERNQVLYEMEEEAMKMENIPAMKSGKVSRLLTSYQ